MNACIDSRDILTVVATTDCARPVIVAWACNCSACEDA